MKMTKSHCSLTVLGSELDYLSIVMSVEFQNKILEERNFEKHFERTGHEVKRV